MKEINYFDKKTVYSDEPLKEIIYEIEDEFRYDSFLDLEYVPKNVLQDIIHRHGETVNEFKKKIAKLFN